MGALGSYLVGPYLVTGNSIPQILVGVAPHTTLD